MERTQKQITGRAPVPYSWDNGNNSRARYQTRDRNAFRVVTVTAARQNDRIRKQNEKMRLIFLEVATVAILVLMLSMVIGKLNRISHIKQDYIATGEVNEMLIAQISISETRLNNLSSDNSIIFLAKTELNMIDPDETSIHVLSNVKRATSDTTHTAGAGVKP